MRFFRPFTDSTLNISLLKSLTVTGTVDVYCRLVTMDTVTLNTVTRNWTGLGRVQWSAVGQWLV
jgi:hypothetical protein